MYWHKHYFCFKSSAPHISILEKHSYFLLPSDILIYIAERFTFSKMPLSSHHPYLPISNGAKNSRSKAENVSQDIWVGRQANLCLNVLNCQFSDSNFWELVNIYALPLPRGIILKSLNPDPQGWPAQGPTLILLSCLPSFILSWQNLPNTWSAFKLRCGVVLAAGITRNGRKYPKIASNRNGPRKQDLWMIFQN